jgi:hypothetical protein
MTLAFRLGPIPVRIHVWFFVIAVLLGLTLQTTPMGVALWSASLLVAVVVHELGHAIVARAFGVHAGVELTPFAPTVDRRVAALSHLRRVAVSLAGPLASLASRRRGRSPSAATRSRSPPRRKRCTTSRGSTGAGAS